MTYRFYIVFIAVVFSNTLFSQNTNISHQVLLLGNVCDAATDSLFVNRLDSALKKIETPFTLLLNGDLTKDPLDSKRGKNQFTQLKRIINKVTALPNGNIVLYAGDRDWNESEKGGQKQFNKLEKKVKHYIKNGNYKKVQWADRHGCPGPKEIEINESLLLVVVNSQWFNHPYDKPRSEDGLCTIITAEDFGTELEGIVKQNQDKNVLIAGHHPFESLGNYGGHFSFADHLKPLPIVGSFRVAYRKNIGSHDDLSNHHLEEFRQEMRNVSFFYKNLIFVSGHDKNQQIIRDGNNYIVNSGAPLKGDYVANTHKAVWTSKNSGMIVLKYYESGKVVSDFLLLGEKNIAQSEEHVLFNSSCDTNVLTNALVPLNRNFTPCTHKIEIPDKMAQEYGDVNDVAGAEYEASRGKRRWLGDHYRSTWTETVNVPTLNLDTTFGGLTIYKKGGGRQTTSLKFKATDGTRYTFRSVNKDPSKALNYKLRPTLLTGYFRDQISSQPPYGAMAVSSLLDELDILHAHPTLYMLPDDPKLGKFQKDYGNLLGMLEEDPNKPNNAGEVFGGADKIYQSNKLFKKLFDSRDNHVDEQEFITARVFDILIGDWSKHEDNWKWAVYEEEGGKYFRPIPRDRDHTFPLHDGILPWLVSREWAAKNIETFDHEIKGLRSVMYQALHMDRLLSTSATKADWIAAAKKIQASISDADIDKSVATMPKETYENSGKMIASKLKARVKDLDKYAEEFYEMLAEYVDVVGSNDKEYFEITYLDSGMVLVQIFDTKKHKKKEKIYFNRTFYPKETKEIRIYGLGDEDIFVTQGKGKSSIKLRLIGGGGDDRFKDKNKLASKPLIYDKGNDTKYDLKGSKVVSHWNKEVYEYDRTGFDYHSYLPIIGMSYNNFNGFSTKVGLKLTRQKFGKDDYGSKHSFYGGISTKGNKQLNYTARYRQVFREWDVPFVIDYSSPEYRNNFYGIGNETLLNNALESSNFYKISHKTFQIQTGISRKFWKKSNIDLMFGYAHSRFDIQENAILTGDTTLFGTSTLAEIPARVNIELNLLDNNGLPYNGIRFKLNYQNGCIIEGTPEVENYGVVKSSIQYFISSQNKKPITLGLRLGGGMSHGKTPFYHLPNIGGATGLRGYSGERFTDKSAMYFNMELRWHLFEKYTSLFPVKFGLKGFYDSGRVFGNNSTPGNWHYGYGGGVYIVPYDEAASLSILIGFSEEQSVYPMIRVGRAF